MTAYTWATLETSVIAALAQVPSPYTSPPANFTQLFPNATSYAEGEITRDLVLLNQRGQSSTSTASSNYLINVGSLGAPSGLTYALQQPLVVVEGVDVAVSGQSYPYDRASLDFVQAIWPNPTLTLAPASATGRFWAPLNDATIWLAPSLDQTYTATITGLWTPAPLSASNVNTYIAANYGDLMFAAVMVWMSGGLLRNYSAMAAEPQQALSWKVVYADLLPGCQAEEARRRGLSVDDLRSRRPPDAPSEG